MILSSNDVSFKTARNIDSIRTEYFDDGMTCERSPRNWARSLTLDDQHQGINLANGASDGLAVLIAPGDVAEFAKEQLRLYVQYLVVQTTSPLDPRDCIYNKHHVSSFPWEQVWKWEDRDSSDSESECMDEPNEQTEQKTSVTVSPTSPDPTVTSLQQKNEMLQARINALEEEKVSISSQSTTSDSTKWTPGRNLSELSANVSVTECNRLNGCKRNRNERYYLCLNNYSQSK